MELLEADHRTSDREGHAPSGSGHVRDSEVAWMESRGNEARERTEGVGWRQEPGRPGVAPEDPRSGEDTRFAVAAASQVSGAQGSTAKRDFTSWVNRQSALYALVLGLICVFLVPLTSFWWIFPVLGAVVPIALAVLDRPGLTSKSPDDRKAKERELLHALAQRGEITPATAAMRTSLTVDEASKMLEELAGKGHLKPRAEDGIIAYALGERDRHEAPGEVSALSEAESESDGTPPWSGESQRLEDPLSERELEVLNLLASGRTNSEVAKNLFVSVGTVKSHTGNIYRKLGAKNRAEALARAREVELLP